jgi:predicted PurR-regulated permease PerM
MADNDQVAAIARSRAEWASLRRRLETVTPAMLARAGLTVGAGLVVLGVAAGTWPALMPFLVGAVIAYSVLPLVNRLDSILPRGLAALVSVLAVVGTLIAIVAVVLPPLVASVGQLATTLPQPEDVDRALADAETWLGGQPLGDQVLAPVLSSIVLRIRETMQSASGGLDEAAIGIARGLASALGAALGLIILPTWMLTVISDQRRGQAVLNRRLAPWLRADFWAVVRIVDRIASTYIRGFIVVGVVVGVLTYLGLRVIESAGGPVFQEPLALAVFAGATQLVPEIGPFIGFLPVVLLAPIAPERALSYLGIYVAARWLGAGMVGGRLLERRLGVHPALLIPSIVILTEFGWIWLFIAAPVVSIAVNTVRYFHGRLSEPARPAGVLPWDAAAAATAAGASPARVPAVYRSLTSAR